MDNWLSLSELRNRPISPTEPEVVFDVVVSPYNMPDAIRSLKKPHGRLRIEFRYIDGDEPGSTQRVDRHVSVTRGRHSHRILGLEVDVDAMGAKSVGVTITAAKIKSQLDNAWATLSDQAPAVGTNLPQARRAFEMCESDLVESLTHGESS